MLDGKLQLCFTDLLKPALHPPPGPRVLSGVAAGPVLHAHSPLLQDTQGKSKHMHLTLIKEMILISSNRTP